MQIGDIHRSGSPEQPSGSVKVEIVDITEDYVYARALNGRHEGKVCKEDRGEVERSLNAGRIDVVKKFDERRDVEVAGDAD